jgi:hypothetical protein
MTTINIPTELELGLSEAARRQGTTPEVLAIETLRRIYAPASTHEDGNGKSLADFLEGYVGTVAGVAEPLSEDTGRRFSDTLQKDRERTS